MHCSDESSYVTLFVSFLFKECSST